MKISARLAALAFLALAFASLRAADETAAAGSSGAGFEAYQTILDRMPFGPEPPNFDPDSPPGSASAAAAAAGADEVARSEEEQQIVSSVRVSVLNVTPSGQVAVGFTDSSVQPPANYYMKVGEARDSWEVREANPSEQTVVLAKNGIEAALKVGEAADGKGKGLKKNGMVRPVGSHLMRSGGAIRPSAGAAMSPEAGAMTLRERLRARRKHSAEELKAEDARRAAAAAEARKDAERAAAEREQAAAERQQQREALLQIQEELRRQREEREAREAESKQQGNEEQGGVQE